MRGISAGSDFVIGHDAIHQDLGLAVDRDDDHHPDEWNRSAAGEEKNGLQRGAIAKRELELKAAPAVAVGRDADRSQRVEHLLRNRHRHDRPDHQREMEAAIHLCAPGMFSGSVMRMRRPIGSSNSLGRTAPLASQRRQNCSGIAEILGGDVIEALAFRHGVLLQQARNSPAAARSGAADRRPRFRPASSGWRAAFCCNGCWPERPAWRRRFAGEGPGVDRSCSLAKNSPDSYCLRFRLSDGLRHGMSLMPNSRTPVARPASRSFCC